MWLAIIQFLGGPIVSGLIAAYKAKLAAGNVDNKIAADEAASEVAAKTQLKIAQVGHPFEPEKIGFYIVVFYMGKAMLWDAAFHMGTTDIVSGAVGVWAGMIVTFYYGATSLRRILGK